MRRFIIGLLLGSFIGGTGAALAAIVAGDNGYLIGWSVTKGGETICEDPFVWTGTREIECD